jgi:hypothetical protein
MNNPIRVRVVPPRAERDRLTFPETEMTTMTRFLPLILLAACARVPGDESADSTSSESIEDVRGALRTFDCGQTPDGVDVPGADAAASLSVEECSPSACFPNAAWRREGDVIFVSCGNGREEVLIRVSG